LIDHATLIHDSLDKCEADGCVNAATVKHRVFEQRRCDRCVSSDLIMSVGSAAAVDPKTLDEHWEELDNVTMIRRVCDYLVSAKTIVAENDTSKHH